MQTVLIVDDDDITRGLMASELTRAGYDVHTATDGVAGLSAIETLRPSLVVLECTMPKLSGIEVCARIRANSNFPDLVVVLVTSNGQEDDVQRGFASGADDYIVKPLSHHVLACRVESLLAQAACSNRAVS